MNVWPRIAGLERVPSPALLLDRERVEANLDRMVDIAGGPDRLRPHVKTHKMVELIGMQRKRGIRQFKCATVAEAELLGQAGAAHVLIAYPLVGPTVSRILELRQAYPQTRFAGLVDDLEASRSAARQSLSSGIPLEILIDLDVGQHRTGVSVESALDFCRSVAGMPGLKLGGLHAYDGHLHQTDLKERTLACHAAFALVEGLKDALLKAGYSVPRVVAGGTPTFPIHARRPGVECSPGTCVFWDAGYAKAFPDLPFEIAAMVLARVISKPAADRLCLDLGHKAVASEMPHPRVIFPELPDAVAVGHNEEHLVLQTERAGAFPVGSMLLGVPWHICPTVALHQEVWVVEHGQVKGTWQVPARSRRIGV